MEIKKYLPKDIRLLPEQPGIYIFYNKTDEIIYVGKSINLRKRVSSYFSESQIKKATPKTQRMVADIRSISFTIVDSEYDALVLENNLIKSIRPEYNILLKYGKGYSYICITNDRFPKVITTRQVNTKLGKYYGPFNNLYYMYQMMDLIQRVYGPRTCNYNLSKQNIKKHKFRVCLLYHIRKCKGPCQGFQTEEGYKLDIAQIEHLLKGNINKVKKFFTEKMQQAALSLAYKEAYDYKMKLAALEAYQAKSLVANPNLGNLDVLAIVSDDEAAFVSYLQIVNGATTFAQTIQVKKKLGEKDTDILPLLILNFRDMYNSTAPEALVNVMPSIRLNKLTLTTPKIGDKKKLVDLAVKNALFLKREYLLKKEEAQNRPTKILELLQQDLQLKSLPLHIEYFDNSNMQEGNPVAALAVFKNGKPAKKEHRHLNIKTVKGLDDFASVHKVVSRRYKQIIEEKSTLPDLIVLDGGKGQLNAAVKALEEAGIYGQVPIISIDKRLEEIYHPSDAYPICLNKQSSSLKLLQQIRNEAHRFAMGFHRTQLSNTSLISQLETIPGIGTQAINKLLQHFCSIQSIKAASLETLTEYIGASRAAQLKTYLQ
jgi:excinuclease ABC subunit C